jgi:anaerobic nitric oxide reductase transcription regulator
MSLSAQAKVLRVLQSGELSRVGSETTLKVDVRVLAATNRDLPAAVASGQFREDLSFRLAVVPLRAPPLRERAQDIPLLCSSFVAQIARENGLHEKNITPEAVEILAAYTWPGNVRELRNVLRRAVALGDRIIHREDLALDTCTLFPCASETWSSSRAADAPAPGTPTMAGSTAGADVLMLAGKSFEQMQNAIFSWALQRNDGSRRRAARALGVSRSTFCDRVRKLGLAPEQRSS